MKFSLLHVCLRVIRNYDSFGHVLSNWIRILGDMFHSGNYQCHWEPVPILLISGSVKAIEPLHALRTRWSRNWVHIVRVAVLRYLPKGVLAQMVERSLSMREVLGSMPRYSMENQLFHCYFWKVMYLWLKYNLVDRFSTSYRFIHMLSIECRHFNRITVIWQDFLMKQCFELDVVYAFMHFNVLQ